MLLKHLHCGIELLQECPRGHAVLIAPGLRLGSPKKREYFLCGLETIGDFAPKLFKLGV
jgi:hypothetical protein